MKTIKKNTFIPVKSDLATMMRYWKGQKSENDKGGSFNLSLYLDYLNVINQQCK
jgi:hypothetical protein